MRIAYGDHLRIDEMSPDEVHALYDKSIKELGEVQALEGSCWTDAMAAIHVGEKQVAAAVELGLDDEAMTWQGLRSQFRTTPWE